MENVILKEAIEIIEEHRKRDIPLRLAVFGPPESGKTDFLKQLIDFCDQDKDYPVKTFYTDLRQTPTSSINDFYRVLFHNLNHEIRHKGIELDNNSFPPKPDVAFESLVEELLKNTTTDVYLFIDHIDTISFELARILVSRFKEFDDKINSDYNYRRLGLCVAGIKTLYELRNDVSSPYIVTRDIIKFPRQDQSVQNEMVKQLMYSGSFTEEQIEPYLNELRNLSGGEKVFLQPVLEYIKDNGKCAADFKLLNEYFDNQKSTVLEHLALRVWSDLSLQEIIRELANENRVRAKKRDPEIDKFQLSGAVVVTPKNFYRFRNDLVRQFLIMLINHLDNPSSTHESVIPNRILELEKIDESCRQTTEFSVFLENLENAWRVITDYDIKSENLTIKCFAANRNNNLIFYVQNKPSLEIKIVQTAKDDYEGKIDEIINDWKKNPTDWLRKKHTFFHWAEDIVTFIYTLPPEDDSLFGMSISAPRNKIDNEFTEFTLGHWVRFIKKYREKIIRLILREFGQYLLKKNESEEVRVNSKSISIAGKNQAVLYWTKEMQKFLTTPSAFSFLKGKLSKKETFDSRNYNNEFQRIFSNSRLQDSASIKNELNKISRDFYLELKNSNGDIKKLCELDENEPLCIESYIEGLGIPFELIPFPENNRRDFLATRIAVSRCLRFSDKRLKLHPPFHHQYAELQKHGEQFRALIIANDDLGELTEVENEVATVTKQLEAVHIKVESSFNANIENIEEILGKEKYQLLHFCGDAKYDPHSEQRSGLRIPSSENPNNQIVSYGRFAQAVKNAGVWLVYLNCCHGAVPDLPEIGQTYLNCMEALVRQGVPNVIGFRWAIGDKGAKQFAEEFYKQLFGKDQVKELSLAMLETRRRFWTEPKHPDVVASSVLISQTVS